MEKYAVIVAGGSGIRLGGGLPKQFRNLKGRPVVWWSMKAFHDEDPSTRIILVLHKDYAEEWKRIFESLPEKDRIAHVIRYGGATRTESVANGILDIPSADDVLIAVHDAARPLVTTEIIADGWRVARTGVGATPAIGVTDSLRKLESFGNVSVDRNDYVAVQTPQVFRSSILKSAYKAMWGDGFTDDVSVTEAYGIKTVLFKGSPHNMKITNPGDIEIAALLLEQRCETEKWR